MHRTFRTPLLPALSGATRTRLYSSTTKHTTQSHTDTSDAKPQQPAQSRTLLKTPKPSLNSQMKDELTKIRIGTNVDMKDMQNLEGIHEMMGVYRRYRDAQERGSVDDESPKVNASDPIHSILTILRVRSRVLKPVISQVRKQIMGTQNEVLSEYLNEIADDLVAGRSYASRFALAYLITAYGTMQKDAQASLVWKRLASESKGVVNEELAQRLADSRVVAAVLRSADPEVVSIDELERMHHETTEKMGRYMLLDEALAQCYVKFKKFDKAVELFASICEHYDIAEWQTSIIRLHNQILTNATDMDIATTFFETAVADDTFIQLHPSAVARYIEHLYDAVENAEVVVDVYERAMRKLSTQTAASYRFATAQCLNMTAEVMKAIVQKKYALEGAVPEARGLIARVIAANPSQLCINTVLSYVFKAWEGSDYIVDLQDKYFVDAKLDFDALRVALSSCQTLSSAQISLDRVIEWWRELCDRKPPRVFDWISLARACDNADRAPFFVDEWVASGNTARDMNVQFEFAPTVYAALVGRGLISDERFNRAFSTDQVDSEVSARAVRTARTART